MSELTAPPAGTSWVFARPSVPVQCCWCGHLFMPGDYAMFAIDPDEPERKWWSHYEERPCYGTKPRPTPTREET